MNRRDLVLASLAALPAPTLAAPTIAAGRRKPKPKPGSKWLRRTVTRTFVNPGGITLLLDDRQAHPYPSVITVRGLPHGFIQKVTVTLQGILHVFTPDLDILLVAPNGHGVVLMSDVGESDFRNRTLTFDDAAATPVPDRIRSGTYKPTNLEGVEGPVDSFPSPAPGGTGSSALAEFRNSNPNGVWKLFVADDLPELDPGTIVNGWSLTIRARIKVRRKRRRRRPGSRGIFPGG